MHQQPSGAGEECPGLGDVQVVEGLVGASSTAATRARPPRVAGRRRPRVAGHGPAGAGPPEAVVALATTASPIESTRKVLPGGLWWTKRTG